ncbi:polyprenyl synthetase family protein [Bacteroidetes bacterium endosymbiont of Geopemphigus sp.]|uniref:polyprenyl synthetase family protein n=1 Tax=Bacteroidetes bacterium endosymbiont of Geopemphigus sp. TaxID=2047937 RepID=UPI000CD011C4|nr:polyprenyl synthetase family protein [Bacteroidetes bacterium endosymbiont of Geopemphigus sp.]
MSKIIKKIRAPIAEEMHSFEKKFYQAIQSKVALLDRITHYIIHRKGKQMRPMLVFLTAKMLGRPVEKTHHAATLIELIHTATLVHDDVVDDSHMRRSFFSINALWKNKIAVLVGDYLLSRSLMIATEKNHSDLLEIISRTIKQMSEGELLQIEKSRRLDINEKIYEEIILDKTASLISACCEGGASSVEADKETCIQMRRFGELAGLAFQIKDDLFDYEQNPLIGKPSGLDIKERKMTLPLIHVIEKSDSKTRKWLINSIKNHNEDKKRIQEIISFVRKEGGLDYAIERMSQLRKEALEILKNYPENSSKEALSLMVNYVIERRI